MNPCDALPQDYGMYYDHCWMTHSTHGIGRVRVIDGTMYFDNYAGWDGDECKRVLPKTLSCWWPRPGAFNTGRSAVYIARRAMRNMRKSAMSNDHYFIKWGSPYSNDPMMILRDGQNHVPVDEACALLDRGERTSIAVARDIIIHPEDDDAMGCFTVVFRGIEAGRLINGCFEAMFSDSPLTGRVLRQLERYV